MNFLARRALHALLLLVGASALTFSFAPGDYFESMRVNPRISNRAIASLRSEYGLDKPSPVLYWHWLESVLKGEGGFSFVYNAAAVPILWPRVQNTLLLASCATLLAWMIALPVGILAAAREGSGADLLASVTIALSLAVPELVLGLVLLLFAVHTGLPAGGMRSPVPAGRDLWNEIKDILEHMLLPAICLAAGLLPLLLSHVRASMRESAAIPVCLSCSWFWDIFSARVVTSCVSRGPESAHFTIRAFARAPDEFVAAGGGDLRLAGFRAAYAAGDRQPRCVSHHRLDHAWDRISHCRQPCRGPAAVRE
jgi:ABC-type amino acid transport system permease subunit